MAGNNNKTLFYLTILLICCLLISVQSCSHHNLSEPFNDETAYLFSYFTDQESGLRLAYSYDGLTWTTVERKDGSSFLVPNIGKDRLMRDPSICQGPDGIFHLVWTTSWWDRIIGYSSSADLIHWDEQKSIPVMMHEQDALNCWAPELYYDNLSHQFYVFWATTIPGRHNEIGEAENESERGLNHRIYATKTKDFSTFTPTFLFFDNSFSSIDATIVCSPIDGSILMAVKNENPNPPEKNIRISRRMTNGHPSVSLEEGEWEPVSKPIHGDFWAEGPSLLFVHDTLYAYYDCYINHRYGVSRSTDNGYTWQSVDSLAQFPKDMHHGTAFNVKKSFLEKLIRDAKQ